MGCHYLQMTNVMSFTEAQIFLCRKELVYYNKNTLISESHTAKGFQPEQDTIILAEYTFDFLKML